MWLNKGYENYFFFMVQMKGVVCFKPNDKMDQNFTEALKQLIKMGFIFRFMIIWLHMIQ